MQSEMELVKKEFRTQLESLLSAKYVDHCIVICDSCDSCDGVIVEMI